MVVRCDCNALPDRLAREIQRQMCWKPHENELGAESRRILSRGRAIALHSVRATSALAELNYLVSHSFALTFPGYAALRP
jgi:hypothetical protein